MSRSVRISVMVVLLLSLIPAGTVLAKSPNDVDDLRGRWEFVAFYITPEGDSLPFDIFINDLAPDPNGETGNEYLAVGWMASPGVDALAPMSLSATHLGDGVYDLSLLSTVIPPADLGEPFVIQFLGTVTTNGKGVPDDVAGGTYRTGFKEGDWSGSHHDRRRTKCPAVGDIPVAGLYFLGDVYVGHNFFGGQLTGSFTQLEGFTNIVSTGMLVQWPGGSTRVIPFFTDIFSRQADFISQIRYLDSDPGNADTSGPYTFTLLDALGDPIPGTTQTDFWTACTQGMPVHFNPVVTPGLDIDLFWDVVPIAPGFNPAVGEGFYQIELYAEPFVPEILFGAHDIGVANHRIPWNDFGGDAPGFEDGRDGGLALSQLDNGDYHVEVMAFSQPAPENPGHGHECFVRDNAEDVFFTKGDASIVFFEPANP